MLSEWGSIGRGVAASVLVAALFIVRFGHATEEIEIRFDIVSSDLGVALNEFAQQSERQIVFANASVEGKQARRMRGAYKPTDALTLLLKGSGLTYKIADNNIIVVSLEDRLTGKGDATKSDVPENGRSRSDSEQE